MFAGLAPDPAVERGQAGRYVIDGARNDDQLFAELAGGGTQRRGFPDSHSQSFPYRFQLDCLGYGRRFWSQQSPSLIGPTACIFYPGLPALHEFRNLLAAVTCGDDHYQPLPWTHVQPHGFSATALADGVIENQVRWEQCELLVGFEVAIQIMNPDMDKLAEGVGFEPTRDRVGPCRFSRPVRSAGLRHPSV